MIWSEINYIPQRCCRHTHSAHALKTNMKKKEAHARNQMATSQPTHDKISTIPFFPAVILAFSFASRITVYCVRGMRFYQWICLSLPLSFAFRCMFSVYMCVNVEKQQVEADTEQKRKQNKHKCQKLLCCVHRRFFSIRLPFHIISNCLRKKGIVHRAVWLTERMNEWLWLTVSFHDKDKKEKESQSRSQWKKT